MLCIPIVIRGVRLGAAESHLGTEIERGTLNARQVTDFE